MISRRSMLGIGLSIAAVPAAALEVQAPPVECVPLSLPKGYIVPFTTHELLPLADPGHLHGYSPMQAVCRVIHKIWDGSQWQLLDSEAGRDVIRQIGGEL